MQRRPELERPDGIHYEGVTREDAASLRSVLEGRSVAPDLVRRFAKMGWIDTCDQGLLLTWAGRCVIETSAQH